MGQLLECGLSDPWTAALQQRALGMHGLEEQLCKKATKLYAEQDRLLVAKKCGIKDWEAGRASGPRALVLGFHLVPQLLAAGVEPDRARYAGEVVAGMHGTAPTVGSWAPRLGGPAPTVAVGPPLAAVPLEALATEPGSALLDAPLGSHVLLAFPPQVVDEDTPVFGLPFERVDGAEVPVRVTPIGAEVEVAYGEQGDIVRYASPAAAVDAVRHWLDWSQEFGREVLPDRIWVVPGVDVQATAQVLAACTTSTGDRRFTQVVVAAEATLLPWSPTVDAIGIGKVD